MSPTESLGKVCPWCNPDEARSGQKATWSANGPNAAHGVMAQPCFARVAAQRPAPCERLFVQRQWPAARH